MFKIFLMPFVNNLKRYIKLHYETQNVIKDNEQI